MLKRVYCSNNNQKIIPNNIHENFRIFTRVFLIYRMYLIFYVMTNEKNIYVFMARIYFCQNISKRARCDKNCTLGTKNLCEILIFTII